MQETCFPSAHQYFCCAQMPLLLLFRLTKFLAFKRYAEQYGFKWGFVRDLDEQLYINNTEFVEDMSDEHWVEIEDEF